MKAFIFKLVVTSHDKSSKKLISICVWAERVEHTHKFGDYMRTKYPKSEWEASIPNVSELPCDDSKKLGDYEILLVMDLVGGKPFHIDPIAVFA